MSLFSPYYSLEKKTLLKRIQWKSFTVSGREVKAPDFWSETAVKIAADKYLKNNESSILQLVDRVVSAIAGSAIQQKYIGQKNLVAFQIELKTILLYQKAFFNSPVWFNVGLFESYKKNGDGFCFAFDFKTGKIKKQMGSLVRPQSSACFIQSISDDLESIMSLATKEARLFKYGSGSGCNFSKLRSYHEPLSGGGKSSGLISFLEVFDKVAGSIKSGGTTRRAAKMVCLNVSHPEIEEFIGWKAHEEKKAFALMKAGFTSGFEGESYRTVSGQNANNSIQVTDQFMQSVKDNGELDLIFPSSGKKYKSVSAKDLFKKIAIAAHACADPGLQFYDQINKWHMCKNTEDIVASNPCSEFVFLNETACNLVSINLKKFSYPDFNLEEFQHVVQMMILCQDILVDMSGYPSAEIAEKTHDYRPLGIGLTGVGAFLMQNAIAYNSHQGRTVMAGLSSLLTSEAYLQSQRLAKSKKPFVGLKKNKKSAKQVLSMHAKAQKDIEWSLLPPQWLDQSHSNWETVLSGFAKYGVRNAQVSVMAPAGTIGLVMDSETTGVEPEFALIKVKQLVGGGYIKSTCLSITPALQKLKYPEEEIKKIEDDLLQKGFSARLRSEHRQIFSTAGEISPTDHLKMMAAIQPFISGAISKTVNVDNKTTVEEIEKIYFEAWQLGLKSVAIYRDGSKLEQPMKAQSFTDFQCFDCG